jgi:hypothetical protein
MKYGLLLLLLTSACNYTESKIVFGKGSNLPTPDSDNDVETVTLTAPAIVIQPHIVNRNQFAEQMTNIFSPDDINFGTAPNDLTVKKEMSSSVWSSRYYMTYNTGDELGEGCDPYVVAFNGNAPDLGFQDTFNLQSLTTSVTNMKYACLMVQAGAVQANLHAKMPVGKIDVYASVNKIRWCENLVASVPSWNLGVPNYAWHNFDGYDNFGITGFTALTGGATLASVALHKAFKSNSTKLDYMFNPDFTLENIIKVVQLFYPTEEDISESAAVFLRLDNVYPENGNTTFNHKQRYEKWKIVLSGTCQSLYWEIL